MKRHCLAIETTGRHLGLALYSFGDGVPQRRASFFKEAPGRQSDLLVPTMKQMLKRARLRVRDLALIAVDIGPGSFTGVRVGLASGRALAQALSIPLVGVNSLEALAEPHTQPATLIVPRIPAVAGEVYTAAYRNRVAVRKPEWTSEEELNRFLLFHPHAVVIDGVPHPEVIAELGIARYLKRPHAKKLHFENVIPMYLQPSWAERAKIGSKV